MIAIVSPAKSLDFDKTYIADHTNARLFGHSKMLLEKLKTKTVADLMNLMGISENLALLNVERFRQFSSRHTDTNAKQAIYAFQGDVYQGLYADDFTEKDLAFAQDHFRMLSGLYGLLRPMDLIQPYRLEMGTALHIGEHKSLYSFWGDQISKLINKDLKAQGDDIVINLASQEYFKSIDKKALKAKIIEVEFKDFKNGDFKIISFFAKKARGLMSRYIIKNQLKHIDDLKSFDLGGYYFDESASNDAFLAFKRG